MKNPKTTLKTVWDGTVSGQGNIKAGYLDTNIAIPAPVGGSGEGADPKELLVSAAAACYTMTLVTILETRQLRVARLTMDSEATDSKEEGFKIVHQPHLVLPADASEEQIQLANRAFGTADKGCGVGNMLKKADVQIDIDGKVSLEEK